MSPPEQCETVLRTALSVAFARNLADLSGSSIFRVISRSINMPARAIPETRYVGISEDGSLPSTEESWSFDELIFAAPESKPGIGEAPYVFVVRADCTPTTPEPEFNRWYDSQHVAEVATAGLIGARRFRADRSSWRYAAIYEMQGRDVMQSERMQQVRGFGPFTAQIRDCDRLVLERVS